MTPIEAELLFARALVLIGLYAFIGLAGYAAWRELRQARRATPAARGMHAARLIVLEGGPTIAGRPALLARRDGGWWIEDLGSRNGVEVNRTRLSAGMPFVVRSGDTVGLGAVRLRLVCPDETA